MLWTTHSFLQTNILIDDNWNAVLADFGLAAFAEATIATHSTAHRGSTRWMAPELHDPESFGLLRFARSRATDVYAFACTCLEVGSTLCPYGHQLITAPLGLHGQVTLS